MLKNNIEIDVKVKCVEEHKKPEKIVNNTFIKMMEQLGYDVQLTYVKKEQ